MLRSRRTAVGALMPSLIVVAVLTGCSGTPAVKASRAPATGTVKGTVTVTDSDNIRASSQGAEPCSILSSSGYSDFRQGAEVDAVNASGEVLAFASLGPGSTPSTDDLGEKCSFPFTISGVPRGQKIYGLQFGRRGTIHFKESAMFGGHADFSIGN